MAEIHNLLVFMNEDDRDRVIKRYESMFDQAGPEGEETLVRCFGSPVRQVLQIEQEYRDAIAQGKTPFVDVDIHLPTAGLEEVWQPEEHSHPVSQSPEPEDEGTRSVPTLDPEVLPILEEIPEEAPAENVTAPEILPPEPTASEILLPEPAAQEPAPAAHDAENSAPAIPELVPEEEIAQELPTPEKSPRIEPPAPAEEPPITAPKESNKPGAGRILAAILATIPMIAMWAILFSVFIVLGAAVLALGAVFAAVAIYLMSYLFSGLITYIPDVMLLGGGILVTLGLAVLLIWTGLWIAVGGCVFTVRLSGSIYRKIIGLEEED